MTHVILPVGRLWIITTTKVIKVTEKPTPRISTNKIKFCRDHAKFLDENCATRCLLFAYGGLGTWGMVYSLTLSVTLIKEEHCNTLELNRCIHHD